MEIIVNGILKDKEEILIVKRSEKEDSYPGLWEFPGGHMEAGENIETALKRELQEEIGLNKDLNFKIINYYDERNKDKYILEIDFLIEIDKTSINIILSDEHTEYRWVSLDSDLMDDFTKSKLRNL